MFGKKKPTQPRTELRCSFCNKPESQSRRMIAGPEAQICDECVGACVEILKDDRKDDKAISVTGAVRCVVCGMPSPLEDVVMVRGRGTICRGCIGAIQAAVAHERDDS
jgi:hypothetical protein